MELLTKYHRNRNLQNEILEGERQVMNIDWNSFDHWFSPILAPKILCNQAHNLIVAKRNRQPKIADEEAGLCYQLSTMPETKILVATHHAKIQVDSASILWLIDDFFRLCTSMVQWSSSPGWRYCNYALNDYWTRKDGNATRSIQYLFDLMVKRKKSVLSALLSACQMKIARWKLEAWNMGSEVHW